jgi:hypothetical protein
MRGRRCVRHDADEIIQVRRECGTVGAVEVRIDVRTAFAGARVAFHPHAEVPRGARQRGANRAHAEQADLLAAQRAGMRRIPGARRLRRPLLEDLPLARQQVAEDVFGHERSEHATGIGQQIVAAERWIEQRFDAGPRRLHPAQGGQTRQRLADQ